MSNVGELIGRLDQCRKTGEGRWIARCPGHKDKSPSLAVTVAGDGKILIHCFAGCKSKSVLNALNMSHGDLLPGDGRQRLLAPLEYPKPTLKDELVMAIAKEDRQAGKLLTKRDLELERRCWLKATRYESQFFTPGYKVWLENGLRLNV